MGTDPDSRQKGMLPKEQGNAAEGTQKDEWAGFVRNDPQLPTQLVVERLNEGGQLESAIKLLQQFHPRHLQQPHAPFDLPDWSDPAVRPRPVRLASQVRQGGN
jgi:hypothetical protein